MEDGIAVILYLWSGPIQAPMNMTRLTQALCFIAILYVQGCAKVPCKTISSTTVPSPDGQWIATVHNDACGAGIGTDAVESIVDIRAAKGTQPPVTVLMPDGWWESTDRPVARWTSVNSLEVTVPNRTAFARQMAELWGISIRVRYENDDPVDRANWIAASKRYVEWIRSGGKGTPPFIPAPPRRN